MAKTIVVTIDSKAETFTQPEASDNAGSVFDLAREFLKTEHTTVMRAQDGERLAVHVAEQARLAEARRIALGGVPQEPDLTLTPETVRVKSKAKGAN